MLGDRIKEIRKKNRLSQIQFSNMIGVSQGTLSELEQNKYNPSLETILAIIIRFNINITWFLLGDHSKFGSNNISELSQMENSLISEYRKLSISDQNEILDIIGLKIARHIQRDK